MVPQFRRYIPCITCGYTAYLWRQADCNLYTRVLMIIGRLYPLFILLLYIFITYLILLYF
jgi:hypothetical protein